MKFYFKLMIVMDQIVVKYFDIFNVYKKNIFSKNRKHKELLIIE